MDGPAARYGNWKAPAEDGQTLIWPDPAAILGDARENGRRLAAADSVRLQNVPLPEVRRRLRHWIGHTADDQPIVATGHQTELHHPGVWVKNVLIDAAARKLGGQAYHFAVDTDAPKHLHLRWPGGSVRATDGPPSGEWSGQLSPPTPAHLRHVEAEFGRAAAGWGFRPSVDPFLRSLRRLTLEAENLPAALTNSLHELDWGLGLRYHALLLSPLCLSEPYLLFAHHVLARADAFAADYNAALADYRLEQKIRSPGRPMPDLKVSADACEVPFWLDSLGDGTRSRARVVRSGDAWVLRAPDNGGGDDFRLDARTDGWGAAAHLLTWLRRHDLRLSPRALTLTPVLRLLVADQFMHGIGGGQYDQVLDRLIARHFGLEPPWFAVTTATLYFPEAVGQPRACLPCVRQEGHRLKHRVLGDAKMRMVAAMEALPRRSWARSALFAEMHDKLNAAAVADPGVKAWERKLADTERRVREERVLFDRELFYAIQPRERLEAMVRRYVDAFA